MLGSPVRFEVHGKSGLTFWINRRSEPLDRIQRTTAEELTDYRPVNECS